MLRTLLIFSILFAISFSSISQNERPKIGLVLSGGGAKGLAHIGVLKVLEEEGIVPDYITGTSMGSIIGGLYAIGYSSQELDSIVRSVKWDNLLTDKIPLNSVSPHEKNDYNRYQVEFTITKDGFDIPSGLVRGQQISELISSLSWHVADSDSFDDLPIPFRCVAADLISGKQFVFEKGDLTTALRASMSIPTVFSPVILDSMLLVDGGVLNNYPVKICRDMGADIIIGVNVGFKDKPKKEELKNFADILMASATIGGNNTNREAIKETDFLISPDLASFNTGSFFNAPEIIELGEAAAREKTDSLRSLMDSLNIKERTPLKIDKTNNPEIIVSQIQINGLKYINKQFLLGNLGIQPGDTITPKILNRGMKRTMGTRYFQNISYDVASLNSGYLLNLDVEESPRAKTKFSLHYDNEYKAGLLANLTLRNIFGNASRTSFSTDISASPQFNIRQLNFLGERQVTAAKLGMDYENNNLPVYLDDGSKYGTFQQNYTLLRGGFMTALGTNWQMDVYVQYEKNTIKNKSGFSEIFYAGVNHFGNSFISSHFDFNYNSIDSRYFPDRGSDINLSYRFNIDARQLYSGSQEGKELVAELTRIPYQHYFTLSGDYMKYFPVSSNFTAGLRLSGQFTSRTSPFLGLTFIGGLPFNNRSNEVHFIGYSFREKLVEDYALGEINLRYKILNQVHINAMGSILLSSINLPEVIEPIGLDKEKRVYGYGLMLAYDSFLGPLQMGMGSNASDNRMRWYFNFGFNF
ncbi:patatin-like phospholipase family protein [Marinilabilia sp.]